MLDCLVGYDEKVIVEPKKASVVPWGYFYWNVYPQAATVAIPDANGVRGCCRDTITLWGVFRRSYPLVVVVECQDVFPSDESMMFHTGGCAWTDVTCHTSSRVGSTVMRRGKSHDIRC